MSDTRKQIMDDRLLNPWRAFLIALPIALIAIGCGGRGAGAEFPLAVGRSWSYMVNSVFETSRVEEVKVLRKVPVGDVSGYELGGPMGQSRIAWKDGVLIAQQLPNATFNPPVPMLVAGAANANRTWKGMIGAGGRGTQATATLVQEPDKQQLAGQTVQMTKSTLTVLTAGNKIELITWFQKGEGPVRQEQRNNDRTVVKFDSIAP